MMYKIKIKVGNKTCIWQTKFKNHDKFSLHKFSDIIDKLLYKSNIKKSKENFYNLYLSEEKFKDSKLELNLINLVYYFKDEDFNGRGEIIPFIFKNEILPSKLFIKIEECSSGISDIISD